MNGISIIKEKRVTNLFIVDALETVTGNLISDLFRQTSAKI